MKRLFSALLSASLAVGLGAGFEGFSVSAAETALFYAETVNAAQGEIVEFTVSVSDNCGFYNCGILLEYDSSLSPLYDGDITPNYRVGSLITSQHVDAAINTDACKIAFSTIGTEEITDDGSLFTVFFRLPERAANGTDYPIKISVDLLSDEEFADIRGLARAADGVLTIENDEQHSQFEFYCDTIYGEAGEEVKFDVLVANNPGFSGCGLRLYYDKRLTPVTNGGRQPNLTNGPAAEGLFAMPYLTAAEYCIGFNAFGTRNAEADGTLFTARFVIPEEAQPGESFPMRLEFDYLDNAAHKDLTKTVVCQDGWIALPQNADAHSDILLGDVNVDGTVTVSDAILSSRIAVEDITVDVSTQGMVNGDYNRDGLNNSADTSLILRHIAKLD